MGVGSLESLKVKSLIVSTSFNGVFCRVKVLVIFEEEGKKSKSLLLRLITVVFGKNKVWCSFGWGGFLIAFGKAFLD